MRIGISVISHEGQNIWENGLGQNVMFLASLFQRLPFVQSVLLIDVGDQGAMPPQVDLAAYNLRIVHTSEATDLVDVIVEMAGALDVQWLDLMRARGKKVVSYCCGQPYVGLIESVLFGKPGHAPRPDRCDEVWILPKDADHAAMLRTLQRCDVHTVPYIWHPMFLEQRIEEVAASGHRYGYRYRQGERKGWRVAIFEPNISVVKNASIPMLICDEAYRADRQSIEHMHVLNTLHLIEHPTMLYLGNSLDLVREHRATFHGRHDIVGFMVQHADVVVSHQWHNDQNYAYLDALYGDYPLIHNSPWLKGAGYYYPDFEILSGAAQLWTALAEHERHFADYRARSRNVFRAVDPFSQPNLDAYARRLARLCRGTRFAVDGGAYE
ncbi:DUF2827 domain-containing protein [Burkholderia territorii]|uniref:DUF2827 domain-containing protein n=1 Tax=Burkholderia territorii TaxID=1503055 RepID=UPI000758044C|nr:DUF2827 domain-containing protein [Burkholderia territorii]KWA08215.1 hypothetical protein WT37_26550 [Burkholderia territorii]